MPEQRYEDRRLVPDERHQHEHLLQAAAGYTGADAPHTSEGASGMLKELTADKIYIVCGHTDMRKSIDGLSAIVQQQFKLDALESGVTTFLQTDVQLALHIES